MQNTISPHAHTLPLSSLVSALRSFIKIKMDKGKDARVQLLADDRVGSPTPKARISPEQAAATRRARMQLTIAMVLCFIFMAGEVVGGYLAKSLAIMTE